tara:strand:+ start:346 stop:699 length:354 start_codon:yes stop_codon:yes gene_type:complete
MLTQGELIKLQSELQDKEMIILKFTASWCGPCQTIKKLVYEYVNMLPSSIKYYEIDIDESLELYMKFKKSKMLNGIPALLAYKNGEKEYWYIPDDSVLGSDKSQINEFFGRCITYVS